MAGDSRSVKDEAEPIDRDDRDDRARPTELAVSSSSSWIAAGAREKTRPLPPPRGILAPPVTAGGPFSLPLAVASGTVRRLGE